MTETPTLQAVARRRGWQTAAQGLGIDVSVAVAIVLVPLVAGVNTPDDVAALWPVLPILVGKSATQAVLAYVLRRYRDKSGVSAEILPPEAPPRHAAP